MPFSKQIEPTKAIFDTATFLTAASAQACADFMNPDGLTLRVSDVSTDNADWKHNVDGHWTDAVPQKTFYIIEVLETAADIPEPFNLTWLGQVSYADAQQAAIDNGNVGAPILETAPTETASGS